ncbi:MAG: UDP-N-acetylglucosamine 2-epimerase (non-hydrolyzing) [Acidobacteria bacterium]|nr:UDP-N-acetylglucosamine 2-epimerase (non-hydrolyzing) [Acidobacteriota bacterium]
MAGKVAVVFGTRPEAIKVAPVIQRLKDRNKAHKSQVESLVISTGQHRDLLDQALSAFDITPDIDLDVTPSEHSPSQVTRLILEKLEPVLKSFGPGVVLVQGDTFSTLGGALTAFFNGFKVGHIESGLRSFNKYRPYPEEINRKLVSLLTDYHFAPTESARDNLLEEGVPASNIYVTGNPVVDAFYQIVKGTDGLQLRSLQKVDFSRRVLVVTLHRRENWGQPLESACDALLQIVSARPDVEIVFPVHPNPLVQDVVHRRLDGKERIHVIEPLNYPAFITLMSRSYLILTDSGGIQEEAPYLGKPVLILREETERSESCCAGAARLVGTDSETIVQEVLCLLDDEQVYSEMSQVRRLYGRGDAADKIVDIIFQDLT